MEERRFSAALSSEMNRALAPEGLPIHTYNLCFLGFGNVNRTLAQLLLDRKEELRDRHGISFRIIGIASRRLGWIADPNGLNACRAGALARWRSGV